jgi:hypothetical protein
MPEETKIEVNKALRRRVKFFGVSRDVGLVLMAIMVLCLMLGTIAPLNITTAIFVTLFLTTLFVLKDGSGEVLAKFRKPKYYMRGCFDYHSPLKNQFGNIHEKEEA